MSIDKLPYISDVRRQLFVQRTVRLPHSQDVVDYGFPLIRLSDNSLPLLLKQLQLAAKISHVTLAIFDHLVAIADDRIKDLLARIDLVLEFLQMSVARKHGSQDGNTDGQL